MPEDNKIGLPHIKDCLSKFGLLRDVFILEVWMQEQEELSEFGTLNDIYELGIERLGWVGKDVTRHLLGSQRQ